MSDLTIYGNQDPILTDDRQLPRVYVRPNEVLEGDWGAESGDAISEEDAKALILAELAGANGITGKDMGDVIAEDEDYFYVADENGDIDVQIGEVGGLSSRLQQLMKRRPAVIRNRGRALRSRRIPKTVRGRNRRLSLGSRQALVQNRLPRTSEIRFLDLKNCTYAGGNFDVNKTFTTQSLSRTYDRLLDDQPIFPNYSDEQIAAGGNGVNFTGIQSSAIRAGYTGIIKVPVIFIELGGSILNSVARTKFNVRLNLNTPFGPKQYGDYSLKTNGVTDATIQFAPFDDSVSSKYIRTLMLVTDDPALNTVQVTGIPDGTVVSITIPGAEHEMVREWLPKTRY